MKITKEQADTICDRMMTEGLIPHEAAEGIAEGGGIEVLRQIRKIKPAEEFRSIMRNVVQPNRAALALTKSTKYIDNKIEAAAFERRIQQVLAELRRKYDQ